MTTIGDVLMIFGGLLALGFTMWGTIVLTTILSPARAARMANRLKDKFWANLLTGAFVTLPVVVLVLVLANVPAPVVKILAVVFAVIFLVCATIGAAGAVRLGADSIRGASPNIGMYESTSRAAILLISAINVPFFGWFLGAPVLLFSSIGCFVNSLRSGRQLPEPWTAAGAGQ
ncbi:hypothetical protein QPK87_19720 [Kamptonema cortianum]|nr:hypothetical protein [Geitlerinema splendidum]MDK3158786.1 hypothetical protein [Kamptonema cortianum]